MKEIRSNENIQVVSSDSRTVEGYGVVFDSESVDLGGFTEIISRNAITQEVVNNSDILFLLDHNRERGVLARSKNGSGSLKVEVDERGVKYSFDAPHTALGDEILEGLRRGDINKCSFAFTVSGDAWTKRNDGSVLRTIDSIDKMYDISIVYNPAYEDTIVVNKRGLDELNESEKEDDSEKDEEADDKPEAEQTEETDEVKDEKDEEIKSDEMSESVDEKSEEDEEKSDEDVKDSDSEKEAEDSKDETDKEQRNLYVKENSINRNKSMKNNKFSLVGAIRDVVNHRNFDDATLNIIKEGRSAAAQSGVSANGQIVLPMEMRAEGDATKPVNGLMATEATIGQETVATDLWDVVGALRDRLVLAQAGAQMITAQGNIEIPVYDGSNVFWESEIGEAKDGAGKFSKVTLSPKRLTAFVDISKQLINQSSESIENMIREDLINAVAEKLQKTILGNGVGSDVEPKGLLSGITADTTAFDYAAAVDMEAALENNNVYGDFAYIVNPQAKAVLRTTSMDEGSGKFLYENNEVLGIPAYSTCSVVTKGAILGDFRQMVVANFGALDITVDEVSRAHFGQIRLVVNFYVDYAVKRPEAFVKRILK